MKMKSVLLLILVTALALSACGHMPQPEVTTPSEDSTPAATDPPTEPVTGPEETVTEEPTEPPTEPVTDPPHSALYIPGLAVEDVITYFNEVCLDAEFINGGNASLLQKWTEPIVYIINGNPTEEDLAVLNDFTAWLNTIEGFPGIMEFEEGMFANLRIHFCSQQEMLDLMGSSFTGLDGAVTFWYMDNEIYDAIICYRRDLDQELRNSVILEEIYNGLGPIQDTALRPDSIIYSEFSQPQALTEIDELILKLLYHPDIKCGMNAAECEAVIRQLYY